MISALLLFILSHRPSPPCTVLLCCSAVARAVHWSKPSVMKLPGWCRTIQSVVYLFGPKGQILVCLHPCRPALTDGQDDPHVQILCAALSEHLTASGLSGLGNHSARGSVLTSSQVPSIGLAKLLSARIDRTIKFHMGNSVA